MSLEPDFIYNIVSLGGALIIFGYKIGQMENKIEKLITTTQINFNEKINHLNDYIDQLKNEINLMKTEIHKDDEISLLRMSRAEYELRTELRFLQSQIKAILQALEKSKIGVNIIDKDTLK